MWYFYCALCQAMGYILFDRFYPVMSKIINQHKYQLNNSKELLQAFETLDEEGKGVFFSWRNQKIVHSIWQTFCSGSNGWIVECCSDPKYTRSSLPNICSSFNFRRGAEALNTSSYKPLKLLTKREKVFFQLKKLKDCSLNLANLLLRMKWMNYWMLQWPQIHEKFITEHSFII